MASSIVLNRFLLIAARRIMALGDTMASRLVESKGADADRVTVIRNWADTAVTVPSHKAN